MSHPENQQLCHIVSNYAWQCPCKSLSIPYFSLSHANYTFLARVLPPQQQIWGQNKLHGHDGELEIDENTPHEWCKSTLRWIQVIMEILLIKSLVANDRGCQWAWWPQVTESLHSHINLHSRVRSHVSGCWRNPRCDDIQAAVTAQWEILQEGRGARSYKGEELSRFCERKNIIHNRNYRSGALPRVGN